MEQRERGFALFVVVALLALMAALVTDFVALARTDIRAARNGVELARARALADAGYAMAVADLINPVAGSRPQADGRSRDVTFDGGRITLAVQDEAGKIDLNWAPIELISDLLAGLEMPGDVAARILGAVNERRADAPRPPWAPGDIAASAILGGPTLERLARMPFEDVGALRSVARIDRTSFDRLLPALTVYSESRRVNLYTAPREVLMAIPGFTAAMADAIVASRSAAAGGAAPLLTGGGDYAAVAEIRAATITADATTDSGARFKRRAVVSFTGVPSAPVRVLEWRQASD